MAFDYSKARATAKSLIEKFGQAGTFVKSGSTGGYDDFGNPLPDQPDIVIDGIVTPLLSFSTDTKMDSYEVEGLNILAGDKYCFVHSGVAPEVGCFHEQNGEQWRVVALMGEINSVDGINVYRKFQVRK